jgi:hypothetical protein
LEDLYVRLDANGFSRWVLLRSFVDSDKVRAEPFEEAV